MRRSVIRVLIILAIAWGGIAATFSQGTYPLLGLDLRGGVEALLTAPEGTDPDVLEVASDVLRSRIEGIGNVQEPEISIVGDRDDLDILVQLPGVENLDEALAVLGQTGQLSFRPVLDEALPDGSSTHAIVGPCIEVWDTGVTPLPQPVVGANGLTDPDDPTEPAWLELTDEESGLVRRLLVGPATLYGDGIDDAVPQPQQFAGEWGVSLSMNNSGEELFTELTKNAANCAGGHPSRQIAIVLDGEVLTAPPVAQSVDPRIGISGGQASIGMGSSDTASSEATDLAIVLRYGALPVTMEVGNVEKVSATLGADSLQSGIVAGLAGLAIVAVALLLYYRSLGIVAVVGLTIFGSFLLLAYTGLGQFNGLSLTLAGVTGIIVSIGITADSYIVYFERIKEELRKGMTMTEAVTDGFDKAYRTILTADFVSLLGAGLLYMLAIDRVKGFALALGVATLLDLFVARWFTRHAVNVVSQTKLGDGGFFSIRGFAGR